MVDKCLWCNAVRDSDIVVKTIDDLDLKLGPMGCCSPDGDGHIWIPVEHKAMPNDSDDLDDLNEWQLFDDE